MRRWVKKFGDLNTKPSPFPSIIPPSLPFSTISSSLATVNTGSTVAIQNFKKDGDSTRLT